MILQMKFKVLTIQVSKQLLDTEIESDGSAHQAALFTLKLREIHKVSQLAMTEIMTEASMMQFKI